MANSKPGKKMAAPKQAAIPKAEQTSTPAAAGAEADAAVGDRIINPALIRNEKLFAQLQEEMFVRQVPFETAVANIYHTENPVDVISKVFRPEFTAAQAQGILPVLTKEAAEMDDILTQQTISTYCKSIKPLIIPGAN
jgi:hypothetical protein